MGLAMRLNDQFIEIPTIILGGNNSNPPALFEMEKYKRFFIADISGNFFYSLQKTGQPFVFKVDHNHRSTKQEIDILQNQGNIEILEKGSLLIN